MATFRKRGPHSTPPAVTPAIKVCYLRFISSIISRLYKLPAAQSPNHHKPYLIPMAEEEFQESDVVFREIDHQLTADRPLGSLPRESRIGRSSEISCSVPVNIPVSAPRNAWLRCADECGDDGELVPPHVIVGRRVAGKMMTLSICGGILKGRDLSEFRNLILRMTGFLET